MSRKKPNYSIYITDKDEMITLAKAQGHGSLAKLINNLLQKYQDDPSILDPTVLHAEEKMGQILEEKWKASEKRYEQLLGRVVMMSRDVGKVEDQMEKVMLEVEKKKQEADK